MNKPISEVIRERIVEHNNTTTQKHRWNANDNIASFIQEEELQLLQDEVAEKVEAVLRSLVIDVDTDHNTHETAKRVAKMYVQETFGGRYKEMPRVTAFPNVTEYDGIYCTGPISVRSTCAHHLQNIVGHCWVGVKPNSKVIGLSKFNRLVHWIVERPQIQEEMTQQIADLLQEHTHTDNVAVLIKAEHHCMTHRGVKEHESDMTTAIMRGVFLEDAAVRDEFYRIINRMKGMS